MRFEGPSYPRMGESPARVLRDVMVTDLQWVIERTLVCQAVALMTRHGIGSVLVAGDGGAPIGIVNGTDLVRRVVAEDRHSWTTRVHEIMTPSVIILDENRPIDEAVDLMAARRIRHVGITRDGRIVGMVAACDVILQEATPTVSVLNIMSKPLATIPLDATGREAAARMTEEAVGCLLVTGRRVNARPGQHRIAGHGDIAGILTERDLVHHVMATDRYPYVTTVAGLMETELRTIDAKDPLRYASKLMVRERIRHLIVTDGPEEIVGLLSIRDVLCATSAARPAVPRSRS